MNREHQLIAIVNGATTILNEQWTWRSLSSPFNPYVRAIKDMVPRPGQVANTFSKGFISINYLPRVNQSVTYPSPKILGKHIRKTTQQVGTMLSMGRLGAACLNRQVAYPTALDDFLNPSMEVVSSASLDSNLKSCFSMNQKKPRSGRRCSDTVGNDDDETYSTFGWTVKTDGFR